MEKVGETMTEKDHQLIVSAIKETVKRINAAYTLQAQHDRLEAIDWLISQLQYQFKHDNPQFDQKKFLDAIYN